MAMTNYFWLLFAFLTLAAVVVAWITLSRPMGQAHVRLDFDHYKDREGR
jgi:hypothetical protein